MAVALATNVTAQVGAIDRYRRSSHHEHPPSVAAATYGAAGEQEKDAEVHLPDASRSHN